MGSTAVGGKGILHTHLTSRLSPSSPSFPFWRSDSPAFFTPGRFDDILPTPNISTRLPYPSSLRPLGSSPWRSPRLTRLLLHPYLVRHLRQLGYIPFPFLPSLFPTFLHLLRISLPLSLLFPVLLPPSPPYPLFSCYFTLFFFTFIKSRSVLCHILFWLTSTVTVCLYVGLSSLFLLFPFCFLQVSVEELVKLYLPPPPLPSTFREPILDLGIWRKRPRQVGSGDCRPGTAARDKGQTRGTGYAAFPSKMRPAPWGWSVYTSAHQSLFEYIELPAKLLHYFSRSNKRNINESLNETGTAFPLSRSRTDLFFEILYFQEFCYSRSNFFPKSKKIRRATPRTPSLRGCASPTHQGRC